MALLFLVAHAPLATALKSVGGHAFPDLAEKVLAWDVAPGESPEQTEAQLRRLLAEALEGQSGPEPELLILTDAFGATPANVAQRLADRPQRRVITGVNLPMVWRAMNYAEEPLDLLVARAVAGATQGVIQVATARPQNQAQSVGARRDDPSAYHHQQ